jgi:hypothetical protein
VFRKGLILIAALAVAAVAPSVASATSLQGAPTLRVVDASHIKLSFAVDKKLPKRNGKVSTKITVAGKAVRGLAFRAPHGNDFVYTATVASDGLQVGSKYPVVFRFASGTVTRQVKVHPKR